MFSINNMDDELESPLLGLTMPLNWNIDEFPPDLLFDDTNNSNTLIDNQPYDISDRIQGFDDAQSRLFDENLLNFIDGPLTLPNTDAINTPLQPTQKNPVKSSVIKSSDINDTGDFVSCTGLLQTDQSLKLVVSPFSYQHCRYEQELNKTLRYIFVPNNGTLTLEMSGDPSVLQEKFGSDISLWMRITRITKPFNGLIARHPYPIWINDKNAKVQNGSLFIPVKGRVTKIENLVTERPKLDVLKKIKQFGIHTSEQLNSNEFYSITTSTAKRTRDEYDLRYYALHFQIFIVDQNLTAYATDLICQTEMIYEYEAKEIKSLPLFVRNAQKHSIKHRQIGQRKKSKTIKKKKGQTRNVKAEGPYPPIKHH